jgi:hypothetical protein
LKIMGRWEYPTSRRILMQVVLCLIFCASVGLAALVTHQRRGIANTRLAAMKYVGPIGVRLPKGWVIERQNQGSVLLVAAEPASANRKSRQITIRRYAVDPTLAPEEFLQDSGLLQGAERLNPAANVVEPITIANNTGVMLAVKKPVEFLFLPTAASETVIMAVSVRPSGIGISLEFECAGDTDAEPDRQMLIDIAGAMDVRDGK